MVTWCLKQKPLSDVLVDFNALTAAEDLSSLLSAGLRTGVGS